MTTPVDLFFNDLQETDKLDISGKYYFDKNTKNKYAIVVECYDDDENWGKTFQDLNLFQNMFGLLTLEIPDLKYKIHGPLIKIHAPGMDNSDYYSKKIKDITDFCIRTINLQTVSQENINLWKYAS